MAALIGGLVAALATLVGLLLSGALTRWGAVRHLDALMLRAGMPDLVGMTPSSYADIELPFAHADVPDLTGKVALVTGGNVGLGYFTALNLARKGARVTIVCRDAGKANKAVDEMNAELAEPRVAALVADHKDLESVADACDAFAKTHDVLDIFVQNAGVSGTSDFVTTSSGVEQTFQVNHLAHFLMTQKLMPLIDKSKLARIAVVSSASHLRWRKASALRDARVVNSAKHYDPFGVYELTKLMNVMFARELHERTGENVIVTSLHPGFVQSDFLRKAKPEFDRMRAKPVLEQAVEAVLGLVTANAVWTSEEGALTQVYCAAMASRAQSGKYFHPVAQEVPPNPLAEDAELRKDLWTMSSEILASLALTAD